jgi:hypothetical protein
MPNAALYLNELRARLANPAVSDPELLTYINAAFRDVSVTLYTPADYDAQVLDAACQYLLSDGKFPEIGSISAGGVSTSFSSGDPKRFKERLEARRQAAWMVGIG